MAGKENERLGPEHIDAVIAGIGLACAAGSDPGGLFGAMAGNITGIGPDSGLGAIDAVSRKTCELMPSPVPWLIGESPGDRILELTEAAMADALRAIPADCAGQPMRVITILPDDATARRRTVDVEAMTELIQGLCAPGVRVSFQWATTGTGGSRLLASAVEAIQQKRVGGVLFGGVDSLVEARCLGDASASGRLMARGRVGGVVPGEAACWLVMTPGRPEGDGGRGLGRISGIGISPTGADGSDDGSDALAGAIQSALADAGTGVHDVGAVVLAVGADRKSELEWHAVSGRFWPVGVTGEDKPGGVPPIQHMPPASEVFRLARIVGWTGAAQWPLALAAACRRFPFGDPLCGDVLVCEAGPGPVRGAAVLRPAGPMNA